MDFRLVYIGLLCVASSFGSSCSNSGGSGLDRPLNFKAANYCEALGQTIDFALDIHVRYEKTAENKLMAIASGVEHVLSGDKNSTTNIASAVNQGSCDGLYQAVGATSDEDQYRVIALALDRSLKALDPHSGYVSKANVERYLQQDAGQTSNTFGLQYRYTPAMRGLILAQSYWIEDEDNEKLSSLVSEYDELIEFNPYIEIDYVLPNSAADKAGLSSGDQIVAVEGQAVTEENHIAILNKIGELDRLTLSITSKGVKKDVTLVRGQASLPAIAATENQDGIGYVRMTQVIYDGVIDDGAARALEIAIQKLTVNAGIDGLILDFRGNPGGFVSEAVDVVDMFIDEGQVVCLDVRDNPTGTMKSRSIKDTCFDAKNRMTTYFDGPLIIIVDESTASAAELIAQALRDYGRAVIVGDATFGKGSSFRRIPLTERTLIGGIIRITTAIYRTASGVSTQLTGTTPHWRIVDPVASKLFDEFRTLNTGFTMRERDYGSSALPAVDPKLLEGGLAAQVEDLDTRLKPVLKNIDENLSECSEINADCQKIWAFDLMRYLTHKSAT